MALAKQPGGGSVSRVAKRITTFVYAPRTSTLAPIVMGTPVKNPLRKKKK